ncbi:DUF3329 domain-containing protein [Aureimonas fodinaquatilis]|uniref:DUF3329 domain-containing protein n=1 Tax=Aureimonas fodinaquatilis TaxID=2565783 RepID=A0A5B0DY75_9HYPH|nr:DUF3329 domain-containing protein [Aureimonas fodinaquatilis]KAA0971734.1 DUF3329 domain-containing protein [Aureimonas fodinaquatilis]
MVRDSNHPFFRPLWRRVAVIAFCVAWAGFEWWNDQMLWAAIMLAITAYGIFTLFINYKAPE